jgi:hypothetical protein
LLERRILSGCHDLLESVELTARNLDARIGTGTSCTGVLIRPLPLPSRHAETSS